MSFIVLFTKTPFVRLILGFSSSSFNLKFPICVISTCTSASWLFISGFIIYLKLIVTGSEKENLWHYKCSWRSRIDRENFKKSYTVEVNIIILFVTLKFLLSDFWYIWYTLWAGDVMDLGHENWRTKLTV